jgi:hypothetical protein
MEFGLTDCEAIRDAFLSQPANAITSLSFVIAGVLVSVRNPRRRLFGLAVALVGMGSFAAHGPRLPGSEWLHDVTIAWVLVVVLVEGFPRRWSMGAVPGVGALFAVAPVAGDAVLVALAGLVIGREMLPARRTGAGVAAVAILAVGALIGTLSRTGWPLCNPDTLAQGHAVWHVMAAVALAVWGVGRPAPEADTVAPGVDERSGGEGAHSLTP